MKKNRQTVLVIKKIKFDNPALYKTKELEVGDTILLGECGIWEISHCGRDGKFYCGGMDSRFRKGQVYDRVFRSEFLEWLTSIHSSFKIGDRIGGYYPVYYGLTPTGELRYQEGVIEELYLTCIAVDHIWMKTDDGYTTHVSATSARKIATV